MFEAVDVIALIKGGVYDDLNLNVGEALAKRSPVSDWFNHIKLIPLSSTANSFFPGFPRYLHLLC